MDTVRDARALSSGDHSEQGPQQGCRLVDIGDQYVRISCWVRFAAKLPQNTVLSIDICLRREPPFNASTPIGTYRLIVAGKFEYPPDFDENAKSIISHFLVRMSALCYLAALLAVSHRSMSLTGQHEIARRLQIQRHVSGVPGVEWKM